jgi:hypothetical protein
MEEDDDEIALDGLLVFAAHPLDHFEQVGDVELIEAALAQQRRLLLEPQAEVALLERPTSVRHRVRAPCPRR